MVIFIWIVFIPLEQKNKLDSHKKKIKNTDFCDVVMPSEDTKILELNQYWKSDETPSINYRYLKSLIKKIEVKMILKYHPQQK